MKQYTSQDVADLLGLSKATVERGLRRGVIKGFKLFGRWYVTQETYQSIKDGKC